MQRAADFCGRDGGDAFNRGYVDPGNWPALAVQSPYGEPRLLRGRADGTISTVYMSVVGTGMSDENCCKLEWRVKGRSLRNYETSDFR